MKTYTVRRRVDSYVDYLAEIEAGSPEEAARRAYEKEDELEWRRDGVVQFDARHVIALDADGFEIDGTQVGKG